MDSRHTLQQLSKLPGVENYLAEGDTIYIIIDMTDCMAANKTWGLMHKILLSDDIQLMNVCCFVGWLLNVPATG